jgi:hypothetical protein
MWESLANILSNSWVVGIGGGIISGIIVYLITAKFFNRKENTRYLEQINNANIDIIRSLKPYIAEKGLPEKEIIDAIILSTARKYKVKSEELYSIRVVCEELIREIVENVYVSADKKQEYTQQLKEYLCNLNAERNKSLLITEIEKEITNSTKIEKIDYRNKVVSTLSIMFSILAATLTMFVTILTDPTTFPSDPTHEIEKIFIVLAVTFFTLALSTVFVILLKYKDKAKRKEKIYIPKNHKN